MSVLQRCPNCGTTQATPGDCEACHDAHVRFFCTNHEPGLWLDGPTCAVCKARSDEAARRRSGPATAVPERARSAIPARERPSVADVAWPKVLRSVVVARRAPPSAAAEREMTPIRQLGGCLVRLLLIAVVLIAVLVGALYLIGRNL